MSVWLDPLETGAKTLSGRYRKDLRPAPTNLQTVNQGQGIYLSWKAPEGVTVEKYNVYRNNQKINETTKLNYLDIDANNGLNIYSVCAVYAGGEESMFISASISFIRHKAPTDLQVVRTSSTRVKISWNAPVYEQTIYWGTLDIAYEIGFGNNIPFYFGQKWLSSELQDLNLSMIKAVQFIPLSGNTYQIYIMQEGKIYRQDINNAALGYDNLNTINLNEPFVIDASKDLIIAIYASSTASGYPAACDHGSAVNGKGNIFSENGTDWHNLYDEDYPGEYNFNFIVTAVVSSEKGVLSPVQSTTARIGHITSQKNALKLRSIQKTRLLAPVDLQNNVPIAFPQIGKYKLYRMGSTYLTVNGAETSFVEVTSSNNYIYQVSAFYGEVESPKSNMVGISTVAIENADDSVDIYPSAFSKSVHFKGFEYSTRLDVVSVTGKICMRLENVGQTIDTSSLIPGIYFFRIYGDNNMVLKTVKAVKIK
ncbi:MAG: hypothetical protein LBN11_02425, partial [Tannerella sp.]|jgi:hypothetical protein|nr:hypothetical protein [Tannerella sp.]